VLGNIVRHTVELIAELKIVRPTPSALEYGDVLVKLDGLIRIALGIVLVLGGIEVPGRLL